MVSILIETSKIVLQYSPRLGSLIGRRQYIILAAKQISIQRKINDHCTI